MTARLAVDLQPPPRSLAIREDDFCVWVGLAAPGQRVEYHRGHLVTDRVGGLTPFGEEARRELSSIAARAMTLAAEGRLLLVQQRHGYADFSYLAIKPNRPPKGSPATPDSRGN